MTDVMFVPMTRKELTQVHLNIMCRK